ncbi:tRNA (uracil-5-)-methyltransferase A [Chionoecetes opilio]|uniref:tRNA (uracil(54)-C(5))-methyltransferase n=1 Tax=Chionoecetes opilio TaxID=41210 RepID=A0A8J5CIQ1_CHIOP|nr:tRNA (uracil-5-)-methyltransferase A [Chionoecetes opilio]
MKSVVEEFEKFIRNSGLAPFSPLTHEGYWRQLNVRTTCNNDILIIPMMHPQDMTEDQLSDVKKKIVTHFTTGPGAPLAITSIFFKACGQKEKGVEQVLELLWGQEYITETILGKKFRVSPDAFLQINTAAAEVLYEKIGSLAELDSESMLLDICCGTGTIGISLADRCKKVYGVELVEKAAEDAKQNAKENGVENVAVFTGKAEDNMPHLMQHCTKANTIGVVDPPRGGLNNKVIFALRKCETMKRLVFVSCDPRNAIRNFISLGRPESKQYKGEFFIPVRAVPVDLFPHTPHFELIILFERWEEQRWKGIMEGNPLPQDEAYFKRLSDKPTDVTEEESHKDKRAAEEQGDGPRKKMKAE